MIKQKHLKYLIVTLLFLVFLSALFTFERGAKNTNANFKNKLTSIEQQIVGLSISSSTSQIKWDIYIENEEVLESFQNGIYDAGLSGPSSHSGPVGEWIINIKFRNGLEHLFFASIHKFEQNDLILSEGVFQESGRRGYFKTTGRLIRLHGWGNWIVKEAPEGLF